jgi:hypothetical protein
MKIKGTIYWRSPNVGATNESGFSALPGGDCYSTGTFSRLMNFAFFWTAYLFDPECFHSGVR